MSDTPVSPIALQAILADLSSIDLTGKISFNNQHPFASGGYCDVFKGALTTDGTQIAVRRLRFVLARENSQFLKVRVRDVFHRSVIIECTQRLTRELRIWSRLSHKNVLKLLGISQEKDGQGYPCFITVWMENGSARTYLMRHPDADILPLVRIIVSANVPFLTKP